VPTGGRSTLEPGDLNRAIEAPGSCNRMNHVALLALFLRRQRVPQLPRSSEGRQIDVRRGAVMLQVRWMYAGLCLLAVAAPAVSQRGQDEYRGDRNAGDSRYDRDDRNRGDGRYDRDDRSRGDRYGNDRRGDGRAGRALPGGSWAQSCRRSTMSGNTLSAQCRDQRGKWRDTQINARRCQSGRVSNRFGTLACE
jgi:hypothetical protein